MHKLTFTLKQHTPIIHFQYDQDGATLRASEVKPKLDKFLWLNWIEKYKKPGYKYYWDDAFQEYKKLLIGNISPGSTNENAFFDGNYNALNYKIKISNVRSEHKIIPVGFPCYFGNLRADKFFSWTNETIGVEITTPFLELKNELTKNIFDFFLKNNFGTRQSKGFGSFMVDVGDSLYHTGSKLYSSFNVQANSHNFIENQKKLFWNINLLYSALRSGINGFKDEHGIYINEVYIKSLLWLYCKNVKHVNWEKRKIKKEFFYNKLADQMRTYRNEPDFEDSPIGFESEPYESIKEVFGFATIEEWKIPYTSTMNESKLIVKTIAGVDRFKSPLYFKPIRENNIFKVLIGFDTSFDDVNLLNREMTYSCEGKTSFPLQTLKTFSHKKFFEFLFNEDFDLEGHVTNGNTTSIFHRLNLILNELKNNA